MVDMNSLKSLVLMRRNSLIICLTKMSYYLVFKYYYIYMFQLCKLGCCWWPLLFSRRWTGSVSKASVSPAIQAKTELLMHNLSKIKYYDLILVVFKSMLYVRLWCDSTACGFCMKLLKVLATFRHGFWESN